MIQDRRQMLAAVYRETVEFVMAGRYETEDGTEVVLPDDSEMIRGRRLYREAIVLGARSSSPALRAQTSSSANTADGTSAPPEVAVWNSDSIDAGKRLLDEGYNVAVLNLASHRNPGGGVMNGSAAQEESLFRRTNLFRSMYQFAHYAEEYGLKRSRYQYPLDRRNGGVYTPGATVIRDARLRLLAEPYQLSFIAVPAIAHPDVTSVAPCGIGSAGFTPANVADGDVRAPGLWLTDEMVDLTRQKMRTIFRIAAHHGHDALVLGAFGCGAFRNPPRHIALLFKEVMQETEFTGRFRKIVFAILEDRNAPRGGNLQPFREVFGC